MRVSKYPLFTLKEIPSESEIISHQLMLRSGMIRKLTSGLYIWLPTGLRVLEKVKDIIRKEMNNIGAIEISMPIIQPTNLWKESGRLAQYGSELIHFIDRNKHTFILGPTNEEMSVHLIRRELNSYKQFPLIIFQIQNKFRDEVRPRFGVIRTREFLMKDAYSFHISKESLQDTYHKMCKTYSKIFTRMGLQFCIVRANTDSMGGSISHEFQAISQNGEDNIIISDSSNYTESITFAEALAPVTPRAKANEKMKLVDTSSIKDTEDLVRKFNLPMEKIVKTLLVRAEKGSVYPLVALLIRGDHEINKTKVEKLPQVAKPLIFATEKEIYAAVSVRSCFLGPVNISIPLVIDRTVAAMNDFVAGANIDGKHFFGINWDRDIDTPVIADIRNVVAGDPSPDGKGMIVIKRGIEIGHIFQLNTKYSQIMNANIHDKHGQNQVLLMGSYGIGITRAIAAVIEQHHDTNGIIWPDSIAPFQVAILPINMHKSLRVQKCSEELYFNLYKHNIDVLIYDQKESPGIMFSNIEMIGIPHIVIVSDRSIDHGHVEYKRRQNGKRKMIKICEIFEFLVHLLKG